MFLASVAIQHVREVEHHIGATFVGGREFQLASGLHYPLSSLAVACQVLLDSLCFEEV